MGGPIRCFIWVNAGQGGKGSSFSDAFSLVVLGVEEVVEGEEGEVDCGGGGGGGGLVFGGGGQEGEGWNW